MPVDNDRSLYEKGDARPLRSKEAKEVIWYVEKMINLWGSPRTILTDNGKEFASQYAETLSEKRNIVWRYGAPYSPTTTRLKERFNRTIMGHILLSPSSDIILPFWKLSVLLDTLSL
jgi:transposase InsO family protein